MEQDMGMDERSSKNRKILSHKEFRSAFVTPEQRRDFLLDCAHAGFKSIRAAWPDADVRMFVFGSATRTPCRVGAGSDLDIAIAGLDHIAPRAYQCEALVEEEFRKGLPDENQTLSIDVVTFDPKNPATTLAMEIVKNGIEIKLE